MVAGAAERAGGVAAGPTHSGPHDRALRVGGCPVERDRLTGRGDPRSAKCHPALGLRAVRARAGPEALDRAVTQEICSLNWQEGVGSPGIRRVLAQLSCRFRRPIWEILD